MKLLPLALAFLTTTAGAGELVLHTGSWHSASTYKSAGIERRYNNLNLGVGYITRSGWAVGGYNNSYQQTSIYGAKGWDWQVARNVRVGVMAGVVTGYQEVTGNSVQPIFAFSATVPVTKSVRFRLTGLPSVSRDTSSVIHLSIGYRL